MGPTLEDLIDSSTPASSTRHQAPGDAVVVTTVGVGCLVGAAVGVGDGADGVEAAAVVGDGADGVGDAADGVGEAAPAVVVAVAVFAAVVVAVAVFAAVVVAVAVFAGVVVGAELTGAEVTADCVGDALVGAGALVEAGCVSCTGELGAEVDGGSVGTELVAAGNSVVTDALGDGFPVAETTGSGGDSSDGIASVIGGIDGSVMGAAVGTNWFTDGSTV